MFGTFVAEVFAGPHIQQALEGGQGIIGSLIGAARFGYFFGGDIREFTDAAH